MAHPDASTQVLTVLGLAAVLAACSTAPPVPDIRLAETRRGAGEVTVLEESLANFWSRYKTSNAMETDDPDSARAMLDAGRVLLDLRCSKYLDEIGMANQSASNVRQQIGLTGGLASALMGITGSSAKEVAAVASGFSFGGSSFDAYTTAYLFADAGTSVIKLVQKAQAAYWDRSDAELARASINHRAAVQALVGYESICRPAEIRALIRDAISKAEVVAEIEVDNGVQLEVVGVLSRMAQVLGVPAVAEDQAVALYARYLGLSTEPVRLAGTEVTDAQMQSLAPVFAPLGLRGGKVGRRWSDLAEKEGARRQAAAAADERTTEAVGTTQDGDIAVRNAKRQLAATPAPTPAAGRSISEAGNAVQEANKALTALRAGNTAAARLSTANAQRGAQQATLEAQAASAAEQDELAKSNAAARKAAEQVKAAVDADARARSVPRRPFSVPVLSVR